MVFLDFPDFSWFLSIFLDFSPMSRVAVAGRRVELCFGQAGRYAQEAGALLGRGGAVRGADGALLRHQDGAEAGQGTTFDAFQPFLDGFRPFLDGFRPFSAIFEPFCIILRSLRWISKLLQGARWLLHRFRDFESSKFRAFGADFGC